jgi:hypothetical protein
LERFIDSAAAENRRAPMALGAYRARVESELALLVVDSAGRETPLQIEQFVSHASWSRADNYRIHVVGYRTPVYAIPLPFFQVRWGVPHLYGDRFSFRFVEPAYDGSRSDTSGRATKDTIEPVHPLTADRDRYYRFGGGDTVATLRSGGRDIPIVRVTVTPKHTPRDDGAAFEGDLYFDATRHQIIRMRGRYVRYMPADRTLARVRTLTGSVMAAYVDITCEEVDGRFWLPATQRVELQMGSGFFGKTRVGVRFVARFRDYGLEPRNDSDAAAPWNLRGTQVTYAAGDSARRYAAWATPLGAATARAGAADFDDVAPAQWSERGRPRVTLAPSRASHLVHFDRVEGWYTGVELALERWSVGPLPGLTARTFAGWAWSERTVRGGAALTQRRGEWSTSIHAERALESTNDFPFSLPLSNSSFGDLLGTLDDNDYVDRSSANISVARVIDGARTAIAVAQFGAGRDRSESARMSHSPWSNEIVFRPNRPAANGSYGRAAVDLDWHPGVSAGGVTGGVGARIRYEVAAGDLAWQRATATIASRRSFGQLTLVARTDAGVVLGKTPPPQQMFEIGGSARLPGYSYKQFVGDRAALLRAFADYALPAELRPRRKLGFVSIPALRPGIGVGVQGGWTGLTTAGAREAAVFLSPNQPLGPTGQVRGSVGFGLTLFAGVLHAGVARPVGQAGPWRASIGVGPGP